MLISVITATYNQGQFISDCINSVLQQTYSNLEFIIVDDGSTDDTRSIVSSIDDTRIRYVYQKNGGLSAARNIGLQIATGDYITYLDSDDLFLPNKLELLLSTKFRGFVSGYAIGTNGQIYNGHINRDTLPYVNPVHVGSVLIERPWQDKVGEFDTNLKSLEDWDMWLRLVLIGCPTSFIPEIVSVYRQHDKQMTKNKEQMLHARRMVLEKLYKNNNLPYSWQVIKDDVFSKVDFLERVHRYNRHLSPSQAAV